MPDKAFRDMTDDELKAEFFKWNSAVEKTTAWGAGLIQASKWRQACEEILNERGITVGQG